MNSEGEIEIEWRAAVCGGSSSHGCRTRSGSLSDDAASSATAATAGALVVEGNLGLLGGDNGRNDDGVHWIQSRLFGVCEGFGGVIRGWSGWNSGGLL